MLEVLMGIVTSVVGGGATGILGVIAQRFADYKNRQLDIQLEEKKFAHEVELKKVDAEIMEKEWAARTKVAEVETAGASDVADSQAFAASYSLEPKRYSSETMTAGQNWLMVILDFMRGIVRPALTIYLCLLVTLLYREAHDLMDTPLTGDQKYDLIVKIVYTVLYVWTTCTLWYFGTRNKQAK